MRSKPCFLGGMTALLLLLASAVLPAGAAPAPPAATSAAPSRPVTADDLQHLVDTLQNDQDRARLVEQLRALIAAERDARPPEEEAPPPTFISSLSRQLNAIGEDVLATATVLLDAPRLIAWIEQQAGDADARARWLEVLLHLAIVFGAAVIAELVVRWLTRRPQQAVAHRTSDRPVARIVLNLLRVVIGLLPILAFAGTAYAVLPLTHPRIATARVAEVVIHSILLARAILIGVRALLLAPHSIASVGGLEEETRTYLYIWARRFTGLAVYGYALSDAAWWLGAPGSIYAILLKAMALILSGLGIIFVLQNRQAVAVWLRGKPRAPEAERRDSSWRILRQRLADTWHVLAILYIVAIFVVYALQLEGGFGFVLRATVASLVLIVAARLVVRLVIRLAERGFAISPELKGRFPTLEARANRYLPVLSLVASSLIYLFAGLVLLQAWGVDAFAWFDTSLGRRVASAGVSIAVVGVVALILWELLSSAIERYLARLDTDASVLARGARARTLLPLLRSTVLIAIVVMVTLIVLAEIGVNIAPLLAGAGVVGLAVGFGSQALVKDVITGLFILIEDQLAVGDVVDVGGGHAGRVEALSIRTLRLRDMAGTVHVVPFSEVHSLKNLTRDFAYFVADVGVLYSADLNRVIAVLNEVGQELAHDPAMAPSILEPLEVIGLDRFSDTAVIIKVRIKVWPLRQWAVGREFNRRMKQAFDANGIEMPAGNQGHYLPEPEPASAEPAPPEPEPAAAASDGPPPEATR